MSNEKQLALSVLEYVQDYNEVYPMGVQSDWWDDTWYRTVAPYVKNTDVFRCPSDPDTVIPSSWSWAIARFTYVSNGYMDYRNGGWRVVGVMGMGQGTEVPGQWMASDTTSIADIKRPAETILLAERQHKFTNETSYPGNTLEWGPGAMVTGVNWWDSSGSPSLLPDGSKAATAKGDPTGPNGCILPAHQDMANFAFADGHVKAMKPSSTNPNPSTRPQDNMWDAYRN